MASARAQAIRLDDEDLARGSRASLTLMVRSFGPVGRLLAPVVRPWSGIGLGDGLARMAALAAEHGITPELSGDVPA